MYKQAIMYEANRQLTLSCIGKRVKLILNVPEYFKEVFENWACASATITYSKHTKQFWVRLVFETDDVQQITGKTQGIDRGLYHQAVTTEGNFFSSSKVRTSPPG